ncbi:MAG: hypothetical protein HRT52_16075 [Colwellia sp.]|nr:hypothetical protein [Colwellia sp.]
MSTFRKWQYSYTPNVGFSGSDSFTYQVMDSAENIAQATISITVRAEVIQNQSKSSSDSGSSSGGSFGFLILLGLVRLFYSHKAV